MGQIDPKYLVVSVIFIKGLGGQQLEKKVLPIILNSILYLFSMTGFYQLIVEGGIAVG